MAIGVYLVLRRPPHGVLGQFSLSDLHGSLPRNISGPQRASFPPAASWLRLVGAFKPELEPARVARPHREQFRRELQDAHSWRLDRREGVVATCEDVPGCAHPRIEEGVAFGRVFVRATRALASYIYYSLQES
ncbi:hypothetical protein BDV93DRAFT_516764 [Ceratobasidium sp. AG-I]|nr:hypothetical protein BDV93DRAFT_516764 [Ceratobasidium sp. AG-I]